ncbi:MAG: hypothetical protein OK454_12025, partial [Thaumarchaeota archaeon]|nr:hypothetical protein [Nitrososphaerota archaeon]
SSARETSSPTPSRRTTAIMLRQALVAPSRVLRSSAGSTAQRAFARPQFLSAPVVSARTVQPRIARWYSAETKTSEPAKDAEDAGDKVADAAESALQKELEAKKKEVLDWKVRK